MTTISVNSTPAVIVGKIGTPADINTMVTVAVLDVTENSVALAPVSEVPVVIAGQPAQTIVTSVQETAVVITSADRVIVAGGGGRSFVFTQSSPSQAWVVFHDLGTKPQITLVIDGVQQFCRVSYPNDQSALLEFNSPTTGQAYCVG